MAETTGISWTDHTFNPWRGCTKVAPECANCYADKLSKRNPSVLGEWGPSGTRVLAAPQYWKEPVRWNKAAEKAGERRRVFCASLADVFEDWTGDLDLIGDDTTMHCPACGLACGMPIIQSQFGPPMDQCPRCKAEMVEPTMDTARQQLFALIDATPWLDWLLLTKRPENIGRMWCSHVNTDGKPPSKLYRHNVWLGASAGCQATADKAIPELLKSRHLAPVLFVSCEPMLDAVEFRTVKRSDGWEIDALTGCYERQHRSSRFDEPDSIENHDGGPHIDWLIIGCESSGKRVGNLGAFSGEPQWNSHALKLVGDCHLAGIAPFVKQIPDMGIVEHSPSKFPDELRVQMFPTVPERVDVLTV